MTTKTTLLAATAITAMAFAGAASADTITGTVNGIAATAAAPYLVAQERADAADTTAAGQLTVTTVITTANKPTLALLAATRTYEIKVDITGGTIPSASAVTMVLNQTQAVGGTAGASACTKTLHTDTSVTFSCTLAAPTVAGPATFDGFTLTGVVANSSAEADISFASSINDVTGGTLVSTVGTAAATKLIDYANVVLSMTTTSNALVAALPSFKLFAGDVLAAQAATNYAVAAGAGVFYSGLASATTVTRDGIVNGATVVLTGPALADLTLVPSFTGIAPAAPVRAGNAATFTLSNGDADIFSNGTVDLTLTQTATVANQVAIKAGQITTAYTPIFASGYTAPTTAQTINSGLITLAGTNFIAPWFSGSQAQSQSQVRLSNTSTQAANVRITVTNGVFNFNGVATTFGDVSCPTVYSVPVNGDLIIDQATMTACVGAFLRGDLLITVEAGGTDITAKMRNNSASGNFETSLGRFSGGTSLAAAQ